MKLCLLFILVNAFLIATEGHVTVVSKNPKTYQKIVCENRSFSIKCKSNEQIKIVKNFYGRASNKFCGNSRVPASCTSNTALKVAQKMCNGKRSCNLAATNTNFGDPCVGTYKYMTVQWRCVKPNIQQKTVCENKSYTLKCDSNKLIYITKNFYGRASNKFCGNVRVPARCTSKTATKVAKTKCNGKKSCNLAATNTNFGDPCVGTYKYMTVSWRCLLPKPVTKTVCENKSYTLKCDSNKTIRITKNFYGRASNKFCGNVRVPARCTSKTATKVARTKCNRKKSCVLAATNTNFGDPCVGTYKYMTVSWRCV